MSQIVQEWLPLQHRRMGLPENLLHNRRPESSTSLRVDPFEEIVSQNALRPFASLLLMTNLVERLFLLNVGREDQEIEFEFSS